MGRAPPLADAGPVRTPAAAFGERPDEGRHRRRQLRLARSASHCADHDSAGPHGLALARRRLVGGARLPAAYNRPVPTFFEALNELMAAETPLVTVTVVD